MTTEAITKGIDDFGWQDVNADLRARIYMDTGDEWGYAMGAWFAVAEVLEFIGGPIPGRWEYRHSPIEWDGERKPAGDYDDAADILDGFRAGEYTSQDLVEAGDVLSDYADYLDEIGKSY